MERSLLVKVKTTKRTKNANHRQAQLLQLYKDDTNKHKQPLQDDESNDIRA